MTKITSSVFVCKKYDAELNNIIGITDKLVLDSYNKGVFSIYLRSKIFGKQIYHVFLFLVGGKNSTVEKNKIISVDDFDIPSTNEHISDHDITIYNRVYNFTDFYFPFTGEYEFIVFAVKKEVYNQNNECFSSNDVNKIFDFLRKSEDSYMLDLETFSVVRE